MKRICSMLLALAMVLGLIPVQVNANTLDNGLEYRVYDDHVEITFYTGDATNIVIPAEIEGLPVTSIDRDPFSHTNLESITLPATVTSIEWESLAYCNKLKGIYVDENNPVYSNDALGILFNKDKTEIVQVPGAMEGIYQIPDEVERIMPYSFAGCKNLTKVIVPAGVKCLDYHSFSRCYSLTEIVIPDSVTRIEDRCFSDCTSLTTISIPNNVTYLGERAFSSCSSLTSIVLPDRLTEIGGETFYGCDSLSSVTISDSVTYIGGMTFYECDSLECIVIPQNVTYIGSDAFSDCRALSSVSFMGDAPQIPWEIFYGVTATAYYPAENETWTEDVMNTCGGTITWVPHTHEYTGADTAPTCTEQGYTTYTCGCGHTWLDSYADALGHDYADGTCTRCSAVDPDNAGVPSPTDPGKGMFAPDEVLTRGMFFYALWNYFDAPIPSYTANSFTDISESDYYYDAVCWAVESGITKGISPTEFGPDRSVNRAQAAIFLWYAFGSPETHDMNPYTDVPENAFFFKASIWATTVECCMGPMDATHFSPQEDCLYGHINWTPAKHTHIFTSVTVPPTCTRQGYTTYTTLCGYSYTAKYEDAWGHEYADGICIHCNHADPNYQEVPRPSDPGCGMFAAEDALTRGMFFYALWNYWGAPEPDLTGDAFTDVSESDYYYNAVHWAVESGIAEGSSPTEFGADLAISKAEAAAWLWNSFGSPDAADAVAWVCEEGFMSSQSDGEFGIHIPCLYGHINWLTGNCVAAPEYLLYDIHTDWVEITGYKLKPTNLAIPAEIDGFPVVSIAYSAFSGCSSLTGIHIPDTVTRIDDRAFYECSSLTSIRIPEGVTTIWSETFSGCSSLAKIHIPDSVTAIHRGALSGCSSLTSIRIPDSVTVIEEYAFSRCSGLTSIKIPDGITILQSGLFNGCSGLAEIHIPSSVTTIYGSAFSDCSGLTSIKIPEGVTHIGFAAFYGCSGLTSIQIPYNLTSIESYTFYGCSSLTSFHIPYGVTVIESHAFDNCSGLTSIDIPSSVTHIGDRAFNECFSLTGIHVSANNPNFSSDRQGVLFDKAKTVLIKAPGAITGSYTVPDSVTTIANTAFHSCSALNTIRIPDSVTSIGNFAFFRCYGLENIYFEGDAPEFSHGTFEDVTATACYPDGNATWTEEVTQDYGGTITWLPISAHTHEYSTVVTRPTCTTQGYTTYTCSCGNICVGDYVPALGHEIVDKVCIRCGQTFRTPFSDVPTSAFYEEPVIWALENGITNGTSDTAFSPEDPCQRAHVVTFLHRAAKNPEPTVTDCFFTDVPEGSFFRKPVLWAVEKGITNGISATEFGSYAICNRAAVVTFLWRAAGKPEPAIQDNPFTDVTENDYFYQAVLWAVEEGITNGIDATHFGPDAACNRAQVVTFLYRAYN